MTTPLLLAILPTLQGTEDHLLGQDLVLTGPDGWPGGWFGKARVVRGSTRQDGLALLVGDDGADLATRLDLTPDPVIVVLYLGNQTGKGWKTLEKAVQDRRKAGKDARVVTRSVQEVRVRLLRDGGSVLAWEEVLVPVKETGKPSTGDEKKGRG